MTKVRRLRHWKQRFDKDAAFIWRQARMFNGVMTVPGELVPDEVLKDRNKLKRLWEASCIELAEFDDISNSLTGERRSASKKEEVPAGAVDPETLLEKDGRKWKVKGSEASFGTKKAALEAAQAIVDKEAADKAAAEKATAEKEAADKLAAEQAAAAAEAGQQTETTEVTDGAQADTSTEPKGEIDPLDA